MRIAIFKNFYKAVSLVICLVTPLQAYSPEVELKNCKSVLLAQINEQKRLKTKGCPISEKLVYWLGLLRDPEQFSPQEIINFLSVHSHWPQYTKLCKKAEEVISTKASPKEILAWFDSHPPLTPTGVIAYGKVLLSHNKKTKASQIVTEAWHSMEFTQAEEKKFLNLFSNLLTAKDYTARLEFLLLNENVDEAQRLIAHAPASAQKIAEVRIALLENKPNTLQKVKSLPIKLQQSEALLYESTKWYRNQGHFQEAADILLKAPCSPLYTQKWWRERNYIARELIALQDYAGAYEVLKNHGQSEGHENFSEAEWLLGWLSLRFLNNPKQAQQHFQTFSSHVEGAISKAKGAYWMGRAFEEEKNIQPAEKYYRKAAKYKTTYYGQLAAIKLREKPFPSLAEASQATAEDKRKFEKKDLVKAAYILKALGADAAHELSKFLSQIASQASNKGERELAVHLAHALSPHDVVWASKKAGRKDPVLLKKAYPTHPIKYKSENLPEKAFIMAIAYKESDFNPKALSSAGAMGLLQLVPKTAAMVAKELRIPHKESHLFDPHHNLLLGSSFLAKLLEDFEHSYVLASAAYNAGPGRVQKWIYEFGDPRRGEVDVIDWVELIPYSETRNYVMRVLENISNYRSREGNHKKTIADDLRHSKVALK